MDRRRRVLVNGDEVLTDAALREAATGLDLRIDAKVRVVDALDIDRSGLSDEQYRYALRAHFDWVVSDAATTRPEFAVEFDGPSHDSPDARRRDALKNAVCAKLGLPILRVGHAVLRPTAQHTVLGVLLECWTAWRGFIDAQERGELAYDEVYDPLAFIELDPDTDAIVQPYNIARRVQQRIARMARAGVLARRIPVVAFRSHWMGGPEGTESYAWVATTDRRIVIGHASVREYSFPGVEPIDLAEGLALLDLGDRLAAWREGDETIPVSAEVAERVLPRRDEDSQWSMYGD